MTLFELKIRIDQLVTDFGEYDVVYREYEIVDGGNSLKATDTPLCGFMCDDETEEFCLVSANSFDVHDEYYET